MKKILALVLTLTITLLLFAGCGDGGTTPAPTPGAPADFSNRTIVFADAQWDSIQLHNAIAGLIALEAFGYGGWTELSGNTPVTHEGVVRGEIEVHMENWVENMDFYPPDIAAGRLQEIGVNFNDNAQGLYVPRFVIYGDPERGIEPSAPTLRTVQDLARYAHVFPDAENPGRGRIYGAIPGWAADQIVTATFYYNGLDAYFNLFRPGSDAALVAAFSSAFERGVPIVGYYWEPTWLLGMYDFVLLENAPFTNDEDLHAGRVAFPSATVTITASNQFYSENPEFVEFLRRYRTNSAMISEALAFMQDTGANHNAAARWLLQNNPQLLDEWLDTDRAQAVRNALE